MQKAAARLEWRLRDAAFHPGKSNRISKDEGIGYRGEGRVLSFELEAEEIEIAIDIGIERKRKRQER